MQKTLMFACALVVAGAVSPALANAPDKAAAAPVAKASAMPPFGKDKAIPAPKIIKKTLPNGLVVWVLPRNGLPRIDYVLAVRGAGHIADDADHPGFARMLAGLLNEGTTTRDSRAIAEAAAGMGGSVGGSTSNDGLLVFGNALTSHANDMMGLLADVVRRPSFPENEVALTKANDLQGLKAAEAQPGFRAERALGQALFGDHPYGRTNPTEAGIDAVTPAYLKAEHARRVRPDRALLVITGRISEGEALKLATKHFGDWQATAPANMVTPTASAAVAPVRVLLERPGSVQATLRIGRPGIASSSPDYVPVRLATTIIGGGFSSRINLNLREDKGYTYGASAGARIYGNGGSFVGGADVRNAVTGDALTEFFKEYRRLGDELVPADEMDRNKRYVAGGYLIANQLQGAVAHTLAGNWLLGLPAEFLGEFVPKIQAVTAEQVQAVGKQYFVPETQSIVVVGDTAAIAEQLKPFGEFAVRQK